MRAYDLDEVEDYIVSLWACYPPDWSPFPPALHTGFVYASLFGERGSASYSAPYLGRPEVRSCVRRAHGDCDALMACFGLEHPALLSPDECETARSHCEGNVRVSCVEGISLYEVRQNLDALGEICEPPPPTACDWTGPRCVDARTSVRCDGGVLRPVDTCDPGLRCTTEDTSLSCPDPGRICWSGVCLAAGPSCEREHCDGDDLVDCRATTSDGGGLREGTRRDCASAGMRCEDTDFGAHCVAAAHDCEPGPATCDGTTLTYCAPDGTVRRYDCAAHGFPRCDAERTGSALCAPEVPWT